VGIPALGAIVCRGFYSPMLMRVEAEWKRNISEGIQVFDSRLPVVTERSRYVQVNIG
jgi:hypothetical protein